MFHHDVCDDYWNCALSYSREITWVTGEICEWEMSCLFAATVQNISKHWLSSSSMDQLQSFYQELSVLCDIISAHWPCPFAAWGRGQIEGSNQGHERAEGVLWFISPASPFSSVGRKSLKFRTPSDTISGFHHGPPPPPSTRTKTILWDVSIKEPWHVQREYSSKAVITIQHTICTVVLHHNGDDVSADSTFD